MLASNKLKMSQLGMKIHQAKYYTTIHCEVTTVCTINTACVRNATSTTSIHSEAFRHISTRPRIWERNLYPYLELDNVYIYIIYIYYIYYIYII